jgi:hypothetical protein
VNARLPRVKFYSRDLFKHRRAVEIVLVFVFNCRAVAAKSSVLHHTDSQHVSTQANLTNRKWVHNLSKRNALNLIQANKLSCEDSLPVSGTAASSMNARANLEFARRVLLRRKV